MGEQCHLDRRAAGRGIRAETCAGRDLAERRSLERIAPANAGGVVAGEAGRGLLRQRWLRLQPRSGEASAQRSANNECFCPRRGMGSVAGGEQNEAARGRSTISSGARSCDGDNVQRPTLQRPTSNFQKRTRHQPSCGASWRSSSAHSSFTRVRSRRWIRSSSPATSTTITSLPWTVNVRLAFYLPWLEIALRVGVDLSALVFRCSLARARPYDCLHRRDHCGEGARD